MRGDAWTTNKTSASAFANRDHVGRQRQAANEEHDPAKGREGWRCPGTSQFDLLFKKIPQGDTCSDVACGSGFNLNR